MLVLRITKNKPAIIRTDKGDLKVHLSNRHDDKDFAHLCFDGPKEVRVDRDDYRNRLR